MKDFSFATLNHDGVVFYAITISFSVERGLERRISKRTVQKGDGMAPADGCDFIANGTSTSSDNFYEVQGCPEIISLDKRYTDVSVFMYALSNNVHKVTELASAEFLEQIVAGLDDLQKHVFAAALSVKKATQFLRLEQARSEMILSGLDNRE